MNGQEVTNRERLMSAKELAVRLSLSKRQVFRLNSCGKIPAPIRIGGSVRWAESTITMWLTAGAPDRKTFEAMKGGASMNGREEQIAERLRLIPPKYRATHRRAVAGKSFRACINAQCLECCSWQSREVTLCTDLGCPLWSVRPYRTSGTGRDGQSVGAGLKNATKSDIG